jgi:hypothetical protein
MKCQDTITELTDEQQTQVAEYRERYWRLATSTEPADRTRAEAAARRLAEIGGVTVRYPVWVSSPDEYGDVRSHPLKSKLKFALSELLSEALIEKLDLDVMDSLRDELFWSLIGELAADLKRELKLDYCSEVIKQLESSIWNSLWEALSYDRRSFSESRHDSIVDPPWLAYYTYAVDALGIECSDEHRELVHLHNELACSCFACWIVPGAIILCERPEYIEIVDGEVVDLTWRE